MSCRVSDCPKRVLAHGYCRVHYERAKRNGNPYIDKKDPYLRFAASVDTLDPRHCWLWAKSLGNGYARFTVDGKHVYAHVWAYEQRHGPVPAGMQLDHVVCDTPRCVNPDHVVPATPRDNLMRGNFNAAVNARKTTCVHGHPFDDANTYWRPDGARGCRRCRYEAGRRYVSKATS